MDYFFDLLFNGLLTGVLYSLIALGLVFIYKASAVLNMAVGEMALLAAFVMAMVVYFGIPAWAAMVITVVVMILMGVGIERFVMRPLVAQPILSLILATLGVAFVLRGIQFVLNTFWPTIYLLEIGLPTGSFRWAGVSVLEVTIVGAAIGLLLFGAAGYFFIGTRMGLALRAVSDHHTAALSVGISIRTMWAMVWVIAGLLALVSGMIWGTRLGVQYAIPLLAFKAFPVVVLGGMDSMKGAILAGLFIGGAENIVSGYVDPFVGGGTKEIFPYFLMLIVLWVRPYGFFGREIIERV